MLFENHEDIQQPMILTKKRLPPFLFLTVLLILVCLPQEADTEPATSITSNQSAITPIPEIPDLNPRKVSLGETLFNDPILSGNHSLSCASCHDLRRGGDDHQRFSRNTLNQLNTFNTPTVFNVNYNFKVSIAGTVDSLEQFYRVNLFSKRAMNNNWLALVEALKSSTVYVALFSSAYADGINQDNVVDALLTFQASLVTPNARFDQYLRGNRTAISEQENRGYRLFRSYGCVACHQGKNVGGNLYQKLGVFESYYSRSNKKPKPVDRGLFNKTMRESDEFYFRVPSLRNVAVTAPYLHDGSIETLDETIRVMGKYQLGRNISKNDRNDIAAFLGSLTGKYKGYELEN